MKLKKKLIMDKDEYDNGVDADRCSMAGVGPRGGYCGLGGGDA